LLEADIELWLLVDNTRLQYRHGIDQSKAVILQGAQEVRVRLDDAIFYTVPQ